MGASQRRKAAGAVCVLLPGMARLGAQGVPPALESPATAPPKVGTHGEALVGMPKFHEPELYDIDEHTGYESHFDGKTLAGWDADASTWRVQDGLMVGETLDGKPRGNNHIVYRGAKERTQAVRLQSPQHPIRRFWLRQHNDATWFAR